MRCDKDCLNCKFNLCKYDIKDAKKMLQEAVDGYERKRHAAYYEKNKERIDAKQKEYDKLHHAENWQRYYASHTQAVKEKNKKYYDDHKVEICEKSRNYYQAHKAEISARRKQLYRERKAKALQQ